MGTTAQKLEYLGTTKSQLKDMINYGLPSASQITSNTTFRNYVISTFEAFLEALRTPDTLFTNLPKKSGSGTSITLNDTANAPMRIILGASELTQDGTPSPSSPQDIHTISGSNTITIWGASLFDNSQVEIGKTWHGGSNTHRARFVISMEVGTQYRVAMNNLTNLSNVVIVEGSGGTANYTSSVFTSAFDFTHTFSSGATTLFIQFETTGTFTQEMADELQVILNAYDGTDYSLDLGNIEYCKIGTYEDRIFKNVEGDSDYSNERDEGAWYIKKNINKVIYNGSENWSKTSHSGTNGFYRNITSTIKPNSAINTVFTNMASQVATLNDYYNTTNTFFIDNDININLDENTVGNTVDSFKTYLENNNLIMYGIAINPTYTKITGTLAEQLEAVYNSQSKDGQTNISQINNDLPFNLSVQAIEDLS